MLLNQDTEASKAIGNRKAWCLKVYASYQHSLHAAALYLQPCQSQLKALDSAFIKENMSLIVLTFIQILKNNDGTSAV